MVHVSPGSVTSGTPAHSTSQPVVCALHSGVSRKRSAREERARCACAGDQHTHVAAHQVRAKPRNDSTIADMWGRIELLGRGAPVCGSATSTQDLTCYVSRDMSGRGLRARCVCVCTWGYGSQRSKWEPEQAKAKDRPLTPHARSCLCNSAGGGLSGDLLCAWVSLPFPPSCARLGVAEGTHTHTKKCVQQERHHASTHGRCRHASRK